MRVSKLPLSLMNKAVSEETGEMIQGVWKVDANHNGMAFHGCLIKIRLDVL